PFNFILALPQCETEAILENLFESLGPPVQRGHDVRGITQTNEAVAITTRHLEKQNLWEADWVIACDGRHSAVRSMLGVTFKGGSYRDHYVMGDFPDTTVHGRHAAIYLDRRGVVECFPLPNGIRRWVVRLDAPLSQAAQEISTLCDQVMRRTGTTLAQEACSMHSSFTAERYEAERFFVGRGARAGGAMHLAPAWRKPRALAILLTVRSVLCRVAAKLSKASAKDKAVIPPPPPPRHQPYRWSRHEPGMDGCRLAGCLAGSRRGDAGAASIPFRSGILLSKSSAAC
ncbi:MAG: FAD-dependent monooxygenase, partial [Rhodothermales bacterium]